MKNFKGLLLFDIDGVIRDVASSYRLAIQETVNFFINWRPSLENIDVLKSEGCWNNDWDASMELIKRKQQANGASQLPDRKYLEEVFSHFYFGGSPDGDPEDWDGFIMNEELLVKPRFFKNISQENFAWGFVSGAEASSAKYVLENRLGLKNPPLIAMGDAPDKPNPQGLLQLARQLTGKELGDNIPPIAYLGDTVADVITIKQAKEKIPSQTFLSFAIAPPHLHNPNNQTARKIYEAKLKEAGADEILKCTNEILKHTLNW